MSLAKLRPDVEEPIKLTLARIRIEQGSLACGGAAVMSSARAYRKIYGRRPDPATIALMRLLESEHPTGD